MAQANIILGNFQDSSSQVKAKEDAKQLVLALKAIKESCNAATDPSSLGVFPKDPKGHVLATKSRWHRTNQPELIQQTPGLHLLVKYTEYIALRSHLVIKFIRSC
jgi:hypothetical protein